LKQRYLRCLKDSSLVPHGYCFGIINSAKHQNNVLQKNNLNDIYNPDQSVINNSPFVENEALRVQGNIFGEFEHMGDYPVFYTSD